MIQLAPDADADLPKDQQDLIFEAGSILESLRILYAADPSSWVNYFDQVLKAAQLGLVGPNAQPELSKVVLDNIKVEITDREAGRVKNKYLRDLGRKAATFGIPLFLLGTGVNFFNRNIGKKGWIIQDILDTATLSLLWSGTMTGVWLSFAISRTTFTFEDLTIIEKDRLEPAVRLIFTGILAVIFGLLFITNAVSIHLGNLSSDRIRVDPVTAFLLGVILGINEKIIGSALTKKTAGLLEK